MVQVSIGLKQPTSPWGPPQQTHPEVRLPEPHCTKPLISLGVISMIWHTLTTACAFDTHNCTEARKIRCNSCILKIEKEFFWRLEAIVSVQKKGLRLATFINPVASYTSYGTSNQDSPRWVRNAGKDVRHATSLFKLVFLQESECDMKRLSIRWRARTWNRQKKSIMIKSNRSSDWFLTRVGLDKLSKMSNESVGSSNTYCIRTGYLSTEITVGKVLDRISYNDGARIWAIPILEDRSTTKAHYDVSAS
jgi:hypothetical protein